MYLQELKTGILTDYPFAGHRRIPLLNEWKLPTAEEDSNSLCR